MLGIRADGNSQIMTGHIMRCLSIAQAARNQGKDIVFITADQEMNHVIAKQNFKHICLNSQWDNLDDEIGRLLNVIQEYPIDTLLLDSYSVTPGYMQALRSAVCLAYLDDLNQFLYPCDLLINYNHYAPLLGYESRYEHTHTRLLLDSKYAPLREEFSFLPAFNWRAKPSRILITTGGSDPYNVAGQLVQKLKKNPETAFLELHVVSGSLNPYYDELQRLAGQFEDVELHQNVTHMSRLMRQCHIAVTAGGSTLYELCACGLPSVFFTFADNQVFAKQAFADELMLYAGDIRQNPGQCVAAIADSVSRLVRDPFLRETFSGRMQALVDGKGATRLADNLPYFAKH